MPDMTEGQQRALRNLAEGRAGGISPFVNIADAQHLTELGFAVRTRQGWEITPAGLSHVKAMGQPPSVDGDVTNFPGANDMDPSEV